MKAEDLVAVIADPVLADYHVQVNSPIHARCFTTTPAILIDYIDEVQVDHASRTIRLLGRDYEFWGLGAED